MIAPKATPPFEERALISLLGKGFPSDVKSCLLPVLFWNETIFSSVVNGADYTISVTAKNTVAACNQCHQDNAKTDWIFSQYYPVLRAAAPRSK